MSNVNKVILIGRVTAQPELRYTQPGTPVASFSIAVNRQKRQNQEKSDVDFINIVAWQKLAEICSQYLDKGKLIYIEGRLQVRNYTTNDGQKRKAYEVVAQDMKMLSRSKSEGPGGGRDDSDFHADHDGSKDYDSLGIQDIGMEDDVPF